MEQKKPKSDFWWPGGQTEYATWYKIDRLPNDRVYANHCGTPTKAAYRSDDATGAVFMVLLKGYDAATDKFYYSLGDEPVSKIEADRVGPGNKKVVGFMVLEPEMVFKALI